MPDINEFGKMISNKTKAVIINTPNNPSGVVYREETIRKIANVLERKQKEYHCDIYMISDEPYRELVYDNIEVPFLTKYYDNTIIAYSYSKSLSLPGERIGYLIIPDEAADFDNLVTAANITTRVLGFVNAPSLIQRTIGRCLDAKVDIEIYNKNRRLLIEKLKEYGYEFIYPEGAFYLFVKALEEDDTAFVKRAKKYNLLVVPGTAFGCPGYIRIAYCVSYDQILRSLPFFEKLYREYRT
jgi:aspartate aminotransferase